MGKFKVEGFLTSKEKARQTEDFTKMKEQLEGELKTLNEKITSLAKDREEKFGRYDTICQLLEAVQQAETV